MTISGVSAFKAESTETNKANNGVVTGTKTANGTKIVDGKTTDKNMFVRLLSAQLKNQDPSNPADSTQYVAQMAQFSALEQMTNLNTTMTFSSANNLVGKTVVTKYTDEKGNYITGTVAGTTQKDGNVYLLLDSADGKFTMSDILSVEQKQELSSAGEYVGKNVTVNRVDENKNYLKGKITSVINGLDGYLYGKLQYVKDGQTLSATIALKEIITVDE
ncbi:flagellar hook capping FlgD N-terminal domain-containing protein [Clostridium cellulovorans]|uniref:Basal-body rod modification protein FlgD n=1 Tax=Clostridium cellulovorans (strain ATCC 35296 / DSM 3052 / OCM 3 / 743B) TaxID=573061 RepID=D9SKG8_CLOC7|nr:flagellar hook capping FlgD N-terminal domain-containing protein [Clostridium cellulovorans]ADL51464.1 flagellar hook capping protein [Clostridium cellulovorans 743B]